MSWERFVLTIIFAVLWSDAGCQTVVEGKLFPMEAGFG